MPVIPILGAVPATKGILSFGFQRSPTHVHNGVDLPFPEGTAVRAAMAGLVTHATRAWQQGFTGYGNVVVIAQEDGTHALYAHLQKPAVDAGEPVKSGEIIGYVGRTQYNAPEHTSMLQTGPHLHFEVSPTPYPQDSHAPRIDPVGWLATGAKAVRDFADEVTRPFARAPEAPGPQSQRPRSSQSSPAPRSRKPGDGEGGSAA